MEFFIDLDSTIAGALDWKTEGLIAQFAPLLAFPLPETITTIQAFFQLPEVIACQQTPLWRQTILTFRGSAPGLVAVCAMPGAVQGVNHLADLGTIRYCTIRKAIPPAPQEAIVQATHTWLTNKHFPHPEHTLFCSSIMNKLLQMYRVLYPLPTLGVMVDDLYEEVIAEFHQLQLGDHPRLTKEESTAIATFLQQHLLIVAFGASRPPTQTFGLQVVPFPSWEHTEEVLFPLLQEADTKSLSFG